MKKVDSVISLICSLSKSEKKHFYSHVVKDNTEKDYLVIYDIIVSGQAQTGREVKQVFYEHRPQGSFEVSIQYLYERLVETLVLLRRKKDVWYDLYTNICKARMLYERSLFHESFELLEETVELAKQYENNEALSVALKLQQEYLLSLHFPAVTREELSSLNVFQQTAFQKNTEIAEYFSLYMLLRYYLSGKGNLSEKERQKEIEKVWTKGLALYASCQSTDFELKKIHTFFQVYYLIDKQDNKEVIRLLKEIAGQMEKSKQLWTTPPVDYLVLLEEILKLVCLTGEYGELAGFLKRLKRLEKSNSLEFQINVRCVLFRYEVTPYLKKGDFQMCQKIMKSYQSTLFKKDQWLTPLRKNELFLYAALIYLGLQDYKKARRELAQLTFENTIDFFPLRRVIRLLHLILLYEAKEYEQVREESRVIRRGVTLKKEEGFKTEYRLMWFMTKRDLPVLKKEREAFWKKLSVEFQELYADKCEKQLLQIFDFTAWIEAKLLRKSLSEVLAERHVSVC
ncbi:MAG: hypothetical protein LUG98_09740 [Tannerellaceae bacterium]|nr:hypothetical protein [Tannerellaceae bacterium]